MTAKLAVNQEFRQNLADASRVNQFFNCPADVVAKRGDKLLVKGLTGAAIGGTLSILSVNTGLDTALHEVVGHGLLGFRMMRQYAPGQGPTFQVNGWDNLKAIGNATSVGEGVKAVGNWLGGHDPHGNGIAGWAHPGNGAPNALGRLLGADGMSAWESIAGSIPGLILNSLAVAGGMKVKESNPTLGYTLVTFGMLQHLMTSTYSWSAAAMSPAELSMNAMSGHDYANFAVRMGKITGASPKAVAVTTACLWTAFVPAVAIAMHLYQKSHETDIVPKRVALQNWLAKAKSDKAVQQEIQKYVDDYPRKKELEVTWKHLVNPKNKAELLKVSKKYPLEMRRFAEYLVDRLPKKTLQNEKKEILNKWKKGQKTPTAQKVLNGFSIFGTIAMVVKDIFRFLGATFVKALAPVGTVLNYATPLFVGLSVASTAYETHKDLKSPDKQTPKAAKVISVAKLIISIACSVGITVATFVPGLQALLVASMAINFVTSFLLSYARHRVVMQRFRLLQSVDPSEWQFMYDYLRVYEEDKAGAKSKKLVSVRKRLVDWIKLQYRARKQKFLADACWKKLAATNLFKTVSKKENWKLPKPMLATV